MLLPKGLYERVAEYLYELHQTVQTASLPKGAKELLIVERLWEISRVEQLLPKVLLLPMVTFLQK